MGEFNEVQYELADWTPHTILNRRLCRHSLKSDYLGRHEQHDYDNQPTSISGGATGAFYFMPVRNQYLNWIPSTTGLTIRSLYPFVPGDIPELAVHRAVRCRHPYPTFAGRLTS